MRYHLKSVKLSDRSPFTTTVEDLEAAFEIFAEVSTYQCRPGTEDRLLRLGLRDIQAQLDISLRLWAELPCGALVSLDLEDANRALSSPQTRANFESSIQPLPQDPGPLHYRLRMIRPDGSESDLEHPSLQAAFQDIADTWDYRFPFKSGFTWGLWRIDTDPHFFALSAQLRGNTAAVPLSLIRAENSFTSAHAALELEMALRSDLNSIS